MMGAPVVILRILFLFWKTGNSVWDEMKNTNASLKMYLKKEFIMLLGNPYFEEWIDAHVSFNSPPSTYFIMESLNEFTNEEKN